MRQILNGDEPAPTEVFIFVNQLRPVTFHNYSRIGRFSSGAFASTSFSSELLEKYVNGTLNYLPFEPCPMDQMALSSYFVTAVSDYRVEYDAEVHRSNHYHLFPSRLSALYAFGDYETCRTVSIKHGWPLEEVRRFRVLDHPLNRVVKVNMERISLARLAYRISMLTDVSRFWDDYWTGCGDLALELPTRGFRRQLCHSGAIWEYLIEGAVQKLEE